MNDATRVDNPLNAVTDILLGEDAANTEEVEKVEEENDTDIEEIQDNVDTLEASDDITDESQDDDEEADNVDTLNNFAEELEIDVQDMYALNITMGEDSEAVTLGGLKDFYESNRDINEARETLKQKEEDLQREVENVKDTPKISNELLQARAQVLSIQDQFNRTDWDTLRQTDPGNYAALQQDYRTQFDIAQQNEQAAEQIVSKHLKDAQSYQQARLFEAMPELKDETVRSEALTRVVNFAGKYGFTPDDINNVDDNRLIRLLIEASATNKSVETVKDKQIKNVKKASKPSGKAPSTTSRKASLQRLTKRAKASGDRRDQIAAVNALIN